MKKSEFTQLTQIIERLVAREVRKQLPSLIAEAFQNMSGKPVVTEQKQPVSAPEPVREEIKKDEFKASLKELFAGVTPVTPHPLDASQQPRKIKNYTKNPVLNQVLNETTPDLRARERMVGAAAYHGGYSTIPSNPVEEAPVPTSNPVVLTEGQESSHAPLATLPEGVSALDIKQHTPPAVQHALTRNYSEMMKIIDKKKKGIA